MTIKRGVSLYSFQNETFLGLMNLEDCIRTCAEMGAMGIEIVGEQTFWHHPEQPVDDGDIANWHELIMPCRQKKNPKCAWFSRASTPNFAGRSMSKTA